MNDLQRVELDLLKCFIAVCEKLELNYFLVCGSALGAARHGGFIPWDDDMDVGMYREDYNKFMELAPALLPEGIFLQNYKTDINFPHYSAKLRNSNTTYIERAFAHLDMNHGIFMDIFPLDGFPTKLSEVRKVRFLTKNYNRKNSTAFRLNANATIKSRVLYNALRILGTHKRLGRVNARFERLKTKHSAKYLDMIKDLGTEHRSEAIPRAYFGKGTNVLFEGISVRVPENCDGYLTALYGDWRTLPPLEKQKGHHYYEICDTEKPYTHYWGKDSKRNEMN